MTTKPADYDALENRLREDCYCSDVGMVEMCKPCQAADAIRDLRAERDGLREALTRAAENMKVAAEFHDCVNCGDGEKQARAALKGKP